MKQIQLTSEEMKVVERAVWATWQTIAGDCGFVRTNYAALEMCLDAGRLTDCVNFRDREQGRQAEAILKPRYQTVGFSNVCKYLSRRIKLV